MAEECAERGAEVYLVCGPVQLNTQHKTIHRIDVRSAREMYDQCINLFPTMDMAILNAAVADYTPITTFDHKTKRGEENWTLTLKPTSDIAATLGGMKKPGQLLVGFALETDEEEANALQKMERKQLDYIVLNSLNDPGAGFAFDTNKVTVFSRLGYRFDWPLKSKREIASDIIDLLEEGIK